MTLSEKINCLSEVIKAELTPVIDRDYWLLEVPYYANVGDALIWQGELDYLSSICHKSKGMFSSSSRRVPLLSKGDLVLFQGGGNFGDLWHEPQEYRKRIMSENPSCKYVIFPQTVHYVDSCNLERDADFFSRYDCTICARDLRSMDVLARNFKNKVLLVPDMAFCIDMSRWNRRYKAENPLVLKRNDRELQSSTELMAALQRSDVDIADWPSMVTKGWVDRVKHIIGSRQRYLGGLYDWYMNHVYRPYQIHSGIRLLNSHTDIYTTRLHACILGLLLGKENVFFFDNSYGKNSGFYETWLSDCGNVRMVR